DTRPEDTAQIGVLNAVWLQFEGGFGSILFLKVLPFIMIAAFAAVVAYVAYIMVRNITSDNVRMTTFLKIVQGILVVFAAWLVWISLTSLASIFTTELPYGQPQTWLTLPFYNNFFLMVVLIWIQTGFAMVILSAALRGIPEETVEAAIVDGANPFQIFFKIKVPQIMPTIVVVWTTITLTVLKVFDIVFAMTNGQWETQVLANYMFDKLFRANDWGVGSASAIIIMLLVTPILVWNVYNARKEMR
ncbi:MAG: sugar ABC transporter permease, partial [Pseudomonadota bacterium]